MHTITVTSGGTAIEPGFVEEEYVRGLWGAEGGDPLNPTPLSISTTKLDDDVSIEPFAQTRAREIAAALEPKHTAAVRRKAMIEQLQPRITLARATRPY